MTTTPYPPLPPEGVTLSDLMGRLKKIESYLDAGDLAAMRELKAQLERAIKERDAAQTDRARLREREHVLSGRLDRSAYRLKEATAHADAMAKQKDEALADNAEAIELLSHYVDRPGSLVEMVRALVVQEPDLVAAFEAYLGFFPESVEVSGPCSHKLNIDPANLGGFEVLDFGRKAETWTTYEDGGRVPDEFRAIARLRGVRRAAVGDKAKALGFTPPTAPAEVKPATFVDSFKGLPVVDVSALVREGLRQPVVVKQLSGEPLRYATDGSAGLDLPFAKTKNGLRHFGEEIFSTGVKLEIPPGYEGQIRPRSSCPLGVEVVFGTIDSDYRGEIKIKVRNFAEGYVRFDKPIAQLVIAPVARAEIVRVGNLSETTRGEGGFGSTDEPTCSGKSETEARRWLPEHVDAAERCEAFLGDHLEISLQTGRTLATWEGDLWSEPVAQAAEECLSEGWSLLDVVRAAGVAEETARIFGCSVADLPKNAQGVINRARFSACTVEEVEAKVREAVRDEAQKAGAHIESCEVKVITHEREKTPSELQAAADEAALIRRGEAAEVAAKAINERIKALKVGDEWTDADALKVGEEAMQAAGYSDLLCYFAETSAGRRLRVRDAFEELTPVIGEG